MTKEEKEDQDNKVNKILVFIFFLRLFSYPACLMTMEIRSYGAFWAIISLLIFLTLVELGLLLTKKAQLGVNVPLHLLSVCIFSIYMAYICHENQKITFEMLILIILDVSQVPIFLLTIFLVKKCKLIIFLAVSINIIWQLIVFS